MRVYAETNYILELVLEQDQHASCEAILLSAETGKIRLAIPTFSVIEAQETLRRRKGDWRDLAENLGSRLLRELGRTVSLSAEVQTTRYSLKELSVKASQQIELRLGSLQSRLLRVADFIPLSSATLADLEKNSAIYEDLHPPDAAVLASILTDPAFGRNPSCFISRDVKGFDEPEIQQSLEKGNCKYLSSFIAGQHHIAKVG